MIVDYQAAPVDAIAQARATRRRRYFSALWSGAAARVVNSVVQVLSLALTVRYLGAERFGMWAMISTVAIWLGIANFGLGNGLVTRLSELAGRDDKEGVRETVSSTFVVISMSSAILFLFLLGGVLLAPWQKIFNIHSALAISEARPSVIVLICLMLPLLPLSIGSAILSGHQRNDIVNLVSVSTSIVGLLFLWVGTRLDWGLPALVVTLFSPGVLADIAACLVARRLGYFPFALSSFRKTEAWSMLKLGAKFLGLQMLGIFLFQSGALIVASLLGAEQVTPYSVTNRLVMVSSTAMAVIFTPLWPAFGEAMGRGDTGWARSVFGKAVKLVVLAWVPMGLMLGLVGRWVINIWAGPAAVPGRLLLWATLAYALCHGISLVSANFLNGVGHLKSQLSAGTLMAVLHIPLSIGLCRRYGIAGIALSQTLLMLTLSIPLTYIDAFRVLRHKPLATPSG